MCWWGIMHDALLAAQLAEQPQACCLTSKLKGCDHSSQLVLASFGNFCGCNEG
jgi:hypothetical protein